MRSLPIPPYSNISWFLSIGISFPLQGLADFKMWFGHTSMLPQHLKLTELSGRFRLKGRDAKLRGRSFQHQESCRKEDYSSLSPFLLPLLFTAVILFENRSCTLPCRFSWPSFLILPHFPFKVMITLLVDESSCVFGPGCRLGLCHMCSAG